MAMDTMDVVRQLISGLLVLTVLLFASTQAVARGSPSFHEETTLTSQSVVVADCGAACPCHGDCDHGLPCCAGGQCATHAGWLHAMSYELPVPFSRVIARPEPAESSVLGLTTEPLSPPPRATA
jgi:hypothetical protein